MHVNLLINGAPYTDRSLRSLIGGFKEILGPKFRIYNFHSKNFRKEALKANSEGVCILYGDLRNYSSGMRTQNVLQNEQLIEILELFPGEKFWMTKFDSDLDHYPEDLIMGRKTRERLGTRNNSCNDFFGLFDGLIWFGEDILEEQESADLPTPIKVHWSEDYIRFKREVLKVSLLELKSKFRKRIEYTHCVPKASIPLGRIALETYKPYSISLVGTLYNNRIFVKEEIQRLGIDCAPFEKYEKMALQIHSLTNYLRWIRVSKPRIKNLQRSIRYISQQSLFLQSKMAWVDPGYFGYLVRKYFEATIAGAGLVGQTNFGITNKGFVKNRNLLASNATDLVDLLKISDVERRQMTTNSLDVIEELHTGKARAAQIIKAISDSSTSYIYSFRDSKFLRIS